MNGNDKNLDRMIDQALDEIRGERLDPATEKLIERAVDRLLRDRTGIIIAHRLATVTRADDILILEDGKVIVDGPNVTDIKEGETLPLGIYVQVAGRKFQTDFEPIIERQIHHLINYIQGVMHIGQRDIAWVRVGKGAIEKGFTIKDIGVVLHAKFHQDFGNILDKVQVTIYTEEDKVLEVLEEAREAYKTRDERIANLIDEERKKYEK
mgnify:CR=1 FL=1